MASRFGLAGCLNRMNVSRRVANSRSSPPRSVSRACSLFLFWCSALLLVGCGADRGCRMIPAPHYRDMETMDGGVDNHAHGDIGETVMVCE